MKHIKNTIFLSLKSRCFQIPSNHDSIINVDSAIYETMMKNKYYKVKSNVKEETFQLFIDHWLYNKVPKINENNFREFLKLSKEFDRMKNIIQIFLKNKHKFNSQLTSNSFHISSVKRKSLKMKNIINIIDNSDQNFEMKNNLNLKTELNKKIKLLSTKTKKFHSIIYFLFQKNGIESFFEYDECMNDLIDACEKEDTTTVEILTKIKVKINDIIYILNEKDKTASLFRDLAETDEIFVPRSIKYQDVEYLVTSIMTNAFIKQNNYFTIQFPNDSELQRIESKAFYYSLLHQIKIPSHVKYIGKDAFSYYTKKIEFADNSELEKINYNSFKYCDSKLFSFKMINSLKNISSYDNNLIIGKSNINQDKYDVLLLASRDIETAIIPPFIEIIESYAFFYCRYLQNIQFSKNSRVRMIGKKAFAFSLLEKISIPSSVTHIEKNAFMECTRLKEIKFSSNSKLISIGENAFPSYSIEKISIPSSVEKFGKRWINKLNLKKVEIIPAKSRNITYLNDAMIIGKSDINNETYDMIILAYENIKNVFIPNYIKHICPNAFEFCKKIKSVYIEENSKLKIIDEAAFERSSLKEISIPPHSELEYIGDHAFDSSSLENILIPSSIKYIGNSAFQLCDNLKTIVFQNNIFNESSSIKIGKNAFSYIHINKIVFPKRPRLKIIPKKAFYCSSIEKIYLPANIIFELNWCNFLSNFKSIYVLKNGQQNIKYYANKFILGKSDFNNNVFDVLFYSRRDIETAIIPSYIKKISFSAFHNCSHLKEIIFSENSELQTIDKNAFAQTPVEKVTIPKHVSQIGKKAFYNCKKLKHVNFQDSMLSVIEDYTFWRCSLEAITIPLHVNKIGTYSFCQTLIESIIIPSSTKTICKCAFANCESLKTVNILENSELRTIGSNAFSNTSIEKIYIPSKLKKIDESWILNVPSLKEVILSPDNENFAYLNNKMIVKKSDPKADVFDCLFLALRDIKKAIVPSYIKRIYSCCFNCCQKLTKIQFIEPSELKTISADSFSHTSIVNISIPQQVKQIGEYAFSNCDKLINVEFDLNSKLKTIHFAAFSEISIEKISIPNQVSFIDENAFEYCHNLKRIEFSPELRILGESAFMGDPIESLILTPKIEYIDKFIFSQCKAIKIIEVNEESYKPDTFISGLINTKPEYLFIPTKYRDFLNK